MDRSFLSRPEVVKASRDYVCVRLATYEDEVEGFFLWSLAKTGSGKLENSVFAILAPDGKKELARSGRSPRSAARDAAGLAELLKKHAKTYPGKAALSSLPLAANAALGVNIAACDNLPAVLFNGKGLEAKAAKLAWSDEFVGRFVWASGEAKDIEGAKPGLLVVQPGKFGDKGKVLAHAAADADEKTLAEALRAGLKKHVPDTGDAGGHVKSGHRAGVFYEPPNPVTDPMEKAARERGKAKRK